MIDCKEGEDMPPVFVDFPEEVIDLLYLYLFVLESNLVQLRLGKHSYAVRHELHLKFKQTFLCALYNILYFYFIHKV